jgi:hypothetical protein
MVAGDGFKKVKRVPGIQPLNFTDKKSQANGARLLKELKKI